jgi:hypothetical protein
MQVHRFRALHGWRAFVGEIAIIVIGVLVALSAPQLVEDRNWRARVAQAERQLAGETNDNFFYGAERIAVRPCVEAQLDRLIAVAMQPGARNVPQPPITSALGTYVVRQPSRPFDTTTWNGIVSDGVAAHLEEDRRAIYATAYNQIADLDPLTEQGQILAASLGPLLFPISLDPGIRERLIERATSLKANNSLLALKSVQMMAALHAVGAAPSKAAIDARFAQGSSRTMLYCREHGLPLANWYEEVMKQRDESIRDGDQVGRYRATRAR